MVFELLCVFDDVDICVIVIVECVMNYVFGGSCMVLVGVWCVCIEYGLDLCGLVGDVVGG